MNNWKEEFKKEFSHSDECSVLRFEEFSKEPYADCYCELKEIKVFIENLLKKQRDEIVKELTEEADTEDDNSLTAEQIKDIIETLSTGGKDRTGDK